LGKNGAVEAPSVEYAPTPAGAVAWQECGRPDAPPLICTPPIVQHLEMMWEKAAFWRPILQFAGRVRYIQYDKLGTGLSDPVDEPADLAGRVEQVVAVLDSASIDRATVMGFSEGGSTGVAMAAWHPERVAALVLISAAPGISDLQEISAYGPVPPLDEIREFWKRFTTTWGRPETLMLTDIAPSALADPAMRTWMPRYERAAASPALIHRWVESALSLDATELLPQVRVPTLIAHQRDDRIVPVASGRYLADHIAGAQYREFGGVDHFVWLAPEYDDYIDTIHEFLAGHGLATPDAAPGRSRSLWDPYDTLTPGERRCVRLAQRGLPNTAIADSLGLSVRTVENNLSRAFGKLGVRSRVELALMDEYAPPR
jgi:pimeloyl-ACP methyl ester carboxylesterase/DNA-binding CsgD family transcriptional regulator